MSEKKKVEIFFIIQGHERGQKDIDHYLPFLYFLSKSDNLDYTAKGFIFDSKINFSRYMDSRFKLLTNLKNTELIFLHKDSFLEKIKKLFLIKSSLILIKFFNKIINKIFVNLSKLKKKDIKWKKRLREELLHSKLPLIFTTNSNTEQLQIVSQIKQYNTNAKWISLPHGTVLCDNQMVLESDLDKNEIVNYEEVYKEIDYSLLTNKLDRDIQGRKGLDNDKTIIIGSPRYCIDWLRIKTIIGLDGEDFKINSNFKTKVLFLVPKKQTNIFTEELVRTIDFISSYQEIELILLSYENHLPKIPSHVVKRKNIRQYLISQEYSSSKLIDWADIVFHVGTGIMFEPFVKNKITVFPRYLTCNTLLSEKYNAGFNLKNRDELRTFCNKVVNSKNDLNNLYNEKSLVSNKKFVDDFVYANTKSVPQNIISSILYIIDKFDN
jgi:hypothetical protein